MSAHRKIRLVSSQSDESHSESVAIQEARGRIEAENAAELAIHARTRAEAQARAIAEGKLRHENELLAFIEARSRADLKLVNDVQERIELERQIIAATHEKLQLEASLANELKNTLRAEQQAKINLEIRLAEEKRALAEHEKNAILDRDATSLAYENTKQEAQIAKVLREKIIADKESLSLMEGKLIAETARAEGAQQILLQRAQALSLLNKAEIEEIELMQLEIQAKQIAQGKVDSIRELKIVAQQRVDVEMLAAKGIENQLKAEEEAVAAAHSCAEVAFLAKQAAEVRTAHDNEYAKQAELSYKADQLAAKQFDHKLELINKRLAASEQFAKLMYTECMVEEEKLELENAIIIAETNRIELEMKAVEALNEKKVLQETLSREKIMALENVVMIAESERIQAEENAVEVLNKKLAVQEELTRVAQLRLQTESDAISEISIRMETELKAIEADNERILLEVSINEIMAAQLHVTEDIISAEKMKEEIELNVLRMSKLHAESEAQAAQAEADALQAHTYANQLAQKRILASQNLQKFIDERVQDERFYLELEIKKCDAAILERDFAKARVEAEQACLAEVEARVSAEKQALLVTNQRQIAEQLVRQAALAKCKMEKQTVLALKSGREFERNMVKLPMLNNFAETISLN